MAEREIAPDVLRGFALLGILLVNIPFMALFSEDGLRGQWVEGFPNSAATVIIYALFVGKFYILFAFLFGYSANYIIKGERTNRSRWAKRALFLILMGAAHFSFFWHGDILFLYGIWALLLIPFLFRTEKTLKIWSWTIYVFFGFLLTVSAIALVVAEKLNPSAVGLTPSPSSFDEVMRSGGFIEAIGPRVELWSFGITSGIFLQGGFVFAAFLMGLRAGRNRMLQKSTAELRVSRAIKIGLFVGLPIEIGAAVFAVVNENSKQTSEAIYSAFLVICFVCAPLLTRMYVALFLILIERKPQSISWLRPAGKMSLTVYITESIIASLIFGPWGLGLFQKVDAWMLIFIAVAIWLALVWFSTKWLSRFQQGPLEFLMHKITASKQKP